MKIRYICCEDKVDMLVAQLTSPGDSGIQLVDDLILCWSPMFAFSTRQNSMFSPFNLKACLCQSFKDKQKKTTSSLHIARLA